METFYNLGISKEILSNLKFLNLVTPTPVQQQAIQPGFEGKDILAIANTGTGKTAAFGIPIIQRLNENKSLSAIILTPTRELAVQVGKHLSDLIGKNIKIKCAVLIGGDSMKKQIQLIKQNPRIFIGTPGRINDHITRKTLNLKSINILVLDETDRMFDLGFVNQIKKIIDFLPVKKQTLLFTATLPKNIKNISEKYLFKPVKISVEKKENILRNIEHVILNIKQVDKYDKLLEELNTRVGSVLVFMKTKHSSKRIYLRLQRDGMSVNAIHGNVRQNKRLSILNKFRNQKFRVLVATDVAARGLDISHIEHVINYDLPQRTEDYIHRIGRTARAGKKGSALSFISENDRNIWKEISKLIDPDNKNNSKDFKSKAFKANSTDLISQIDKNNNSRNLKRKFYKSKDKNSRNVKNKKSNSRAFKEGFFKSSSEDSTTKRNNKSWNSKGRSFKSNSKDPATKKNNKSWNSKESSFKSNGKDPTTTKRNKSWNSKGSSFKSNSKDPTTTKKNKSWNSKGNSFKSNSKVQIKKKNNDSKNSKGKLFKSRNKGK